MTRGPREKMLWTIAILVVLLYALFPVAWIVSLSLKPTDKIADKKFFSGFSSDNYDSILKTSDFTHALVNSIGIALIATLISIVLASLSASAPARLDFAAKALTLWGALAIALFPPISVVG